MKQRDTRKTTFSRLCLFYLIMAAFICSCSDDDKRPGEYDPSKPVVFTDFTPNEGRLRTRMYIRGENFGTDVSKIHITIGGQEVNAIGSDGKEIYCMVPRRAFDGIIKVTIDGDDGQPVATHEFEKRFNYLSETIVGTLVGYADENNDASNKDGSFAEAQFNYPEWLLLDDFVPGQKSLMVTQGNTSIRKVDLINEEVSTVMTNGQGSFKNLFYNTFDLTGDTIFVMDDNGQKERNMRLIAYLLRSENFRKAHDFIYDRCGYSVAYHPISKEKYYNTYWNATLSKAVYDEEMKEYVPKEIFKVYDTNDAHSYLTMHPTGDYMYIVGNSRTIYKAVYNKAKKEFDPPFIFAGRMFSGDGDRYRDGVGTEARFDELRQGVFVKNEDYVKAGKDDVYDFYVCDQWNHCIRKIDPEGYVGTFAGRGSARADGGVNGYIDGDLRKEAQFYHPRGIAYDESEGVFYIADSSNRRIRTISKE